VIKALDMIAIKLPLTLAEMIAEAEKIQRRSDG